MPELPEVETVRRGLEPLVDGIIQQVEVFHPRAIRKSSDLIAQLQDKKLVSLQRRGKFLWFNLEDTLTNAINPTADQALVIHLGMSGQLLLNTGEQHRHRRISLEIRHDQQKHIVNFIDQRTFGFFHISPLIMTTSGVIPEALAHIAPDIMDAKLDFSAIIRRSRMRASAIKTLLLNQSHVSGIGNIYADEALWQAEIHPASIAKAIPTEQLSYLLSVSQEIMRAAIHVGGTSFDSLYVAVNGQSGKYSADLRAYGRAGKNCYRCGEIMQKIMLQQRSTCFCLNCQKLYE